MASTGALAIAIVTLGTRPPAQAAIRACATVNLVVPMRSMDSKRVRRDSTGR
jgi:hypothetical protein